LGVGLLALYDKSGTGQLTNTTLGLSTAYHHAFGDAEDKPTVLSVGAQAYIVQKSINIADLRFGDQYNPLNPNSFVTTKESFNNRDLSYADFNSGAMLTGYVNEKSTYYVGGSYYHITRPTESFLFVNNAPKINSRLSLSAGGNIQMNDNLMLLASTMFQKQGPATEFLLGGACGFIMNPLHDEYTANSILYLGTWYRLQDAIAPYMAFEWGKSKLGLSYDITTSSFTAATKGQGALEISYVYNGCIIRNDAKKYNFACPRF
jgi:type IX secretion system PorP/SprF family membrane protein